MKGSEGCNGPKAGNPPACPIFSGWTSKDEFCINWFCHHGYILQGLNQFASFLNVCHVRLL